MISSINKLKNSLLLLLLILSVSPSYADWVGPTTIVKGPWGRGLSQFGYKPGIMKDRFPERIHVLPDDRILVEDWLNYRFKIFAMTGEYLNSVSTLYQLVVIDSDRLAGFYWDAGASKPRVGVYSINQKKWLWHDEKTVYNFNTSKLEVANNRIYTWNAEEEKGYNYSAQGKLIKVYTRQPLELGVQNTKREGPLIKTTLSFPDNIYTIYAKDPVLYSFRDEEKNLYHIKIIVNSTRDRIRQIYRYDICGKEKGVLQLPLSTYEALPSPQGKLIPITEYGDPVISYSGDVYSWVRSKSEYKIVKWTWVDKGSNGEGGPDEPGEAQAVPTASGVFLTWKPSPQDPGCVTGYEIQKAASDDGTFGSGTIVTASGKQSYIFNDATATPGERWYYRIRSVSAIGKSTHVEVNAAMP